MIYSLKLDTSSFLAMTEKNKTKTRIAIAVFDAVENIQLAKAELVKVGLGAENIFVIIRTGILEGLDDFHVFSHATDEVDQRSQIISKSNESASPEHGNFSNVTNEETINELIRFENWMVKRLYKDLEKHLNNGHSLLIAIGLTESIEQSVYKTLVSYSIDRIQIHDYTYG